MTQEDYVSYEVAKLLKEKGFSERSYGAYNLQGEFQEGYGKWNKTLIYYAAPTLQMAMKWLREVHNLFIDIYYIGDIKGYKFTIESLPDENVLYSSDLLDDTYEQAVEAACIYALKNVI